MLSFKAKAPLALNLLQSTVNDAKQECLEMLDKVSKKKGINLCVESPTCCEGHAETNTERKVPLRQHFGDKATNDELHSCGVRTGSSTVGADISANATRETTNGLKMLCAQLSKIVNNGWVVSHKCIKRNIDFNHVTVLHCTAVSCE